MVRSGKITINGIKTGETIVGDGHPVLMVHGWGANHRLMEPLALRLGHHGYQCHLFDLPGFGDSDEPPEPFTILDYSAFCLAYMDHHQLTDVNYFGHSLGGRIGLILGSDHSHRIRKLVLSNSAGIKTEAALHRRVRLSLYKAARSSLKRVGARSAAEGLREIYGRQFGSDDFRSASPVMRQTLINVVNKDLLDYAKRVSVATILIWGDEDQDTPLWMGQTLEAAIPNAALIVHAGAGHYAYLDFPDKTASIMEALYRSG